MMPSHAMTQHTQDAETRRLFFALWPPADVADELVDRAQRVLAGHGRVVSPGNIHLTLAFLGDVAVSSQSCNEDAATGVAASAFTMSLDEMGYWRRSGILWAGCDQEPAALHALVGGLQGRLAACGFEADARPYRVHLTLARHVRHYSGASRGGKAALMLRRERVDPMPPLAWHVQEFMLIESRLSQGGTRYEILRRFPL